MAEKDETTSEAARKLRRIPSKKRDTASRENGKKGGRPFKPLEEILCSCKRDPHLPSCRRQLAIERRTRKNADAN